MKNVIIFKVSFLSTIIAIGCSNSDNGVDSDKEFLSYNQDLVWVSSSASLTSSSSELKSYSSFLFSSSSEECKSSDFKGGSSSNLNESSNYDLSSSGFVADSIFYKPKIVYSVDGTIVEENNGCVEIDRNRVTVSCGGTYEFSGANDDAQILINTLASDSTVHVKLNNLTLKNSTDAPFFVINSSRTIIKNMDGSINTFEDASARSLLSFTKKGSDKKKFDTTVACIYSKDDLTINGNGKLIVIANYKNGIQSTKDIRIRDSPTIEVVSPNNAIKGKGSVDIEGGQIYLVASDGNGIKSDEGSDEEMIIANKGSVRIRGGIVTIHSGDDGIQAYNEIVVSDEASVPSVNIKSKAKGMKASRIKMGNAFTSVFAGSDGWKAFDRLEVFGGYHYMNVSSDGIDVKNAFLLSGGTIVIENLSVNDSAAIVAFDAPISAQGGNLLGFGNATKGGFSQEIPFTSKKYYGTKFLAFRPSFNGSVIVVESDSLDIEERDVDNWMSVCFPNESINCFFMNKVIEGYL